MKMFKQLLIAIVAMIAHGTAAEAYTASSPSSVLPGSTYSYATFNNGDVVFRLTSGGVSGCYGFWLRATDPGIKSEVASLLAVIATQAVITVYADTSQIWTGSASPYCLVYMIAQ
jgi:hypothetical protein